MGLRLLLCACLMAIGLCVEFAPAGAADHFRTVAPMRSPVEAEFKEGTPQFEETADGRKAMRLDEPFHCRIDLNAHDVEPRDFDLIKFEVKADRGAVLRLAVENYPEVGDVAYWYVLDGMRGPMNWNTIWVDLKVPEEIKAADDHRSPWREGMAEGSEKERGLQLQGSVKDLGSKQQGPGRTIRIGRIRFIKQAVRIDWDQTRAPYRFGRGEDLVYTYPLTLTNMLDRPVTAEVELHPFEVRSARAAVSENSVPLEPGETKTIEAEVSLPTAAAAEKEPLYCERFLVTARAEDIEDSRVTVLRSSDPIHLTVTVPLDERKLKFPYFPRPSELPAEVLNFDEELARQHAAKDPEALIRNAMQHGLYQYGYAKDTHNLSQYRQTLLSAAYLYDMTGEKKHLRTAKRLLMALPDIWERWYSDYREKPVRIISSGIVARWNDRSHYTLGLGWLVMGTQRAPYYYGTSGNGCGGSMGALAYGFDIIAPEMDESTRQKIIDGFFVPAGLQARNHYIGDGNQQLTANVTALYAGIVSRNWPLVSFAYSSEHGYQATLKWCFDDDGVQIRKNYQTYTMRPILWANELLYGCGLNLYKKDRKRLVQIIRADTRAKNMGGPFQDHAFWSFVEQRRLK